MDNYDPAARIIRPPFSGSKGPLFHARWGDVRCNLERGHTTLGPDHPLSVEGPWLRLRLPSGTQIDLELGMRRFTHSTGCHERVTPDVGSRAAG